MYDPEEVLGLVGSTRTDFAHGHLAEDGQSVEFTTLVDFDHIRATGWNGPSDHELIIQIPADQVPSKGFIVDVELEHVQSSGALMGVELCKKRIDHGANLWKPIQFHTQKFNVSGSKKTTTFSGFALVPALVSSCRCFKGPHLDAENAMEVVSTIELIPKANLFSHPALAWKHQDHSMKLLGFSRVVNHTDKGSFEKLYNFLRSEHVMGLLRKLVNYIMKKDARYRGIEEQIRSEGGEDIDERVNDAHFQAFTEISQRHFQAGPSAMTDITISDAFEKIVLFSLAKIQDYRSVMLEKGEELAICFRSDSEVNMRELASFQAQLTINFITFTL